MNLQGLTLWNLFFYYFRCMSQKDKEYKVKEHQLFISPLKLWLRLRRQNKISSSKKKMARKITFFVLLSAPFRWLQKIIISGRIKKIDFSNNPPVFVIGHWRSGTTHLHYLLAQDKQFTYLDSFQAFFLNVAFVSKGIMRPVLNYFMPATRPQDNVEIDARSPQEEEHPLTNLTEKSGMQVFFFPKNRSYFDKYNLFEGTSKKEKANWKKTYLNLLKQISLFQGKDKKLLLKNPHSIGRIEVLLELFPDAKFIYIHRDPYEVYASTRHLYNKAVKTQFLQDFTEKEIEERVLYCYEKTIKKYLSTRDLVSKGNLIEVAFDDLDNSPLTVLKNIYNTIDLGNYNEIEPKFIQYLESVKNYKKNKLQDIPPETMKEINSRWKFAFDKWGYSIRQE